MNREGDAYSMSGKKILPAEKFFFAALETTQDAT